VHTKLHSEGLIDTDERIIVKWIMKKFELKIWTGGSSVSG